MKLFSRLPANRFVAGEFWAEDHAGKRIFGPTRARGEADNRGAGAHGNPQEDAMLLFGDHPGGLYRVLSVEWPRDERYGPAFLRLDPLEGEALEAKLHGRSGLGIHGGRLHADGRLRETYGCLRVDNEEVETLGHLVEGELKAGRIVFYECRIGDTPDPGWSAPSGVHDTIV